MRFPPIVYRLPITMDAKPREDSALKPVFVSALTDAQFALYSFICMLVGNRHAADDILQDTNVILMEHAGEYDAKRAFMPWAKAFAYNRVRTYLKKESRCLLVFNEELVTALAEQTPAETCENSGRELLEYLDTCMHRLTPDQQALIQAHYYRSEKVAILAERLKRTEIAVYVQIHRIRRLLGACIEEKLQAAGAGGGA